MLRLRTLTIGITTTAVAAGAVALGGATGAAAAHHAPSAAAKHGVTVSTRHTGLGTILVGPNGHTLYLFERDEHSTKSHCYGACMSVWPPLLTHAKPHAAGKAKAGRLGTTKRKDGTKQVTYRGHPVYYYVTDHSAGQTTGEGVDAFGAEWYALSKSGHKVEESGHSDDGRDDHGGDRNRHDGRDDQGGRDDHGGDRNDH